MSDMMGAKSSGMKDNQSNQGGDKAAERAGANKGIVDHVKVDMIDHAKTANNAKRAMSEYGQPNCTYFDGGKR